MLDHRVSCLGADTRARDGAWARACLPPGVLSSDREPGPRKATKFSNFELFRLFPSGF